MKNIKKHLNLLGIQPKKQKGQNFLIDEHALQKIIEVIPNLENQKIVEIGSGLGALSKKIYNLTKDAYYIELEEKFADFLKNNLPPERVIFEDILNIDLKQFGDNLIVFGNIPYSISSAIISYLVSYRGIINQAVLLVQEEFGKRLYAQPGTSSYGRLSAFVQAVAKVYPISKVSKESFYPKPKVDSLIILFRFYKENKFNINNFILYQRVLHSAFSKKRKKIINSLKSSPLFSNININQILDKAGIRPDIRPGEISIEQYSKLTNITEEFLKQI